MRFDVYAGESLVRSDHIQAVMAALEANHLLTDKTSKESDNNWKEKKAAMSQGTLRPTEEEDAGADPNGRGVAKAVDLNRWKLGKPVVQKPGTNLFPKWWTLTYFDS